MADGTVCIVVFVVLLVIGIAIGVGVGVSNGGSGSSNDDDNPNDNGPCGTVDLNTEIRTGNNYVSLVFTQCPSAGAFSAFSNAANRWSEIISQNRITPLTNGGVDFDIRDVCGFIESEFVFSGTFLFDHLVIVAEPVGIDGVNGVLAQAGPCALSGNGFPVIGGMQFDTADLNALEEDGTLEAVVTHEMGHVLGIGTLWSDMKQGGGFANSSPSLLADPIFEFNNQGQLSEINVNNIPKFLGTNGRLEFGSLTGGTENFVPVEDGRRADNSFFFNVANGQGVGSIDGHWKITVFDNELMVFAIDPNDATHPISRVTISSLTDLGYGVDITQADEFPLVSSKKSSSKSNLRASIEDGAVHVLHGDIAQILFKYEGEELEPLKEGAVHVLGIVPREH